MNGEPEVGVRAVYALSCDRPDCFNAYAAPYRATRSAQAIRRAAARDGWHANERGKTYCPDHKPAETTRSPR